jgi:flavin-binding protein dodecin
MSHHDHTYKVINVVGTSNESYEKAIQNAILQAKKTLEDLKWFEVAELRGGFHEDEVIFQASLKIGFKLHD